MLRSLRADTRVWRLLTFVSAEENEALFGRVHEELWSRGEAFGRGRADRP